MAGAAQAVPVFPARGWAAVGGCAVIAIVATVIVDYQVWRFAPAATVFVAAGVAAFAVAGALVRTEDGQAGNAALLWWSAGLFLLDKAYGWPRTPLILLGQWFGWIFAVTLTVVLLRYPRPRLTPRRRRMVVIIAGTLLVARTGAVLAGRRAELGRGAPLDTSRIWWPAPLANPALSVDCQRLFLAAIVAGVLAVQVALVRRVAEEGPLLRGEIALVLPVTTVLAVVVVVHPILLATLGPSVTEEAGIAVAQSAAILLVPLIFIVGAVRRASRAPVADLVLAVEPPVTSVVIRDALRRTLGDPALEILYATAAPSAALVDVSGRPVAAPQPDRTRMVVRDRQGRDQAVVEMSTEISTRRRPLVDAALAATALAISHARLEVTLRMQLTEVRASRARIAEATLTERRRIERDLHDGIQQRLLAIGATMGQLAQRTQEGIDLSLILQAREGLRAARRELADLAHGLHPGILASAGLGPAVESVAARLPLDVTIDIPRARWPADVELAAYYIVCEGLTNVVKHAGAGSARVTVAERDGRVLIMIADDGAGGATVRDRGGLAGLRDRASAAGGDLAVGPGAGNTGTTLTASLPCG